VIQAYRDLLIAFSKNTTTWSRTSRALREYMTANDPDYPTYHLVAPEGWINDPNGVTFDPSTGLYHRFYQYNKYYSATCNQQDQTGCAALGVPNGRARTWGHTVSKDLAIWEDWPGIDADFKWDQDSVWSGNCVIMDAGGVTCIYDGVYSMERYAETAVCAYSSDWVHWEKRLCLGPERAPSYASQTQHDSSIWRDGPGGTWFLLSGGCTYNGSNDNTTGAPCLGNAQLWNSTDLRNFSYVGPIAPGGPSSYWELPYLLPFGADGQPLDNDHHADGAQFVLMFGGPNPAGGRNSYWVGAYDNSSSSAGVKQFTPRSAVAAAAAAAAAGGGAAAAGHQSRDQWPPPKGSDSADYYSFNPHATDNRGADGGVRRLMFGWVLGELTRAVVVKAVPYWQSAHSMARLLTVRGESLVQLPAPEVEKLRVAGRHWTFGPVTVPAGGTAPLSGLRGDALEIVATFSVGGSVGGTRGGAGGAAPANSSFGVALRVGGGNTAAAAVGYRPGTRRMGVGRLGDASTVRLEWAADVAPQPASGVVELRIFLDRSVLEVYSGGAAFTARCNLDAQADAAAATGVELWAEGGDAQLVRLEAWGMGSMWGDVGVARGASGGGS
jgi:beta-fructofuranosidase